MIKSIASENWYEIDTKILGLPWHDKKELCEKSEKKLKIGDCISFTFTQNVYDIVLHYPFNVLSYAAFSEINLPFL